MTVRDYRNLLDLMVDGVVYRKNHAARKDPDADYIHAELISKLRRSLSVEEGERLFEAVFTSMVREDSKEATE